ncbi:DNA-binding protein [Duganella callida]|uniref:KfrA N-terminal DNA-binding domain-containing protein n=1 Tax=Duganella callida TaxID=2561932 RepID=A0A4Y9SR48_9BURK|nr:DNA-binding protein [Duganella callida]TFW27113.1 hypothetical protein E4L98_07865 [Duganella callida]
MARTGLTKSQVRTSRDQLLAEGRYPSVDAVRLALGNTGSKSTIHKYLKELAEEDSQADGLKREDTARTLQALVEQLADKLHAGADQRIRSYELALQEKDEELAALRNTVAWLEAKLAALQGAAADGEADTGFGNFSDLLLGTRGGRNDDSPFNVILSGGRSAVFGVDGAIQITLRS